MTDEPKPAPGGGISVNVSGTNTGNIAAGENNRQGISNVTIGGPPSEQELRVLADEFEKLRAIVEEQAPADVRESALERLDDLEEASSVKAPDVSVMAATRNWFTKHAPGVLGAVTGVIVNPIVGRIVQAAGDAVAREYREKFPTAPTSSGPST
jgi:hypothetical protein